MAKLANTERARRHAKIMLWSMIIILSGAIFLPLTGYVYVDLVEAQAANGEQTNPRAEYWRAVREGQTGYTAAAGPYTTATLIQNGGQNWRQMRNGPVATYGPWVLAVVLGAIFLFHLIKRGVKVEAPRSGRTVLRWTLGERILHWYTAVLFIILSITGLSMFFGRAVLIPLLGSAGFAAWANFALLAHNYLGPFFVVGIFLEIVLWIRHNIPNATDFKWFAKGGGLLGKSHPSAGRMNGGEKVWFWIIVFVGGAVCATGLIMDFPNLGFSRENMQIANLIHGTASIIWISVALGHMYLGTLGTQGALEGMTTGRVSSEWAKQHHDQWYEEVKHTEETSAAAAPEGAAKTAG